MRGIMMLEELSDDDLLNGMKEHSQSIGNYTKAFCLVDDQSMKNIHDGLAIDVLLEQIKLEEPVQLELFS